jgi:hypothetical protein
MRVLTLALILSFSVPGSVRPARPALAPTHAPSKPKGGRWFVAANGHAVYCYGPVMTMPQAQGGLLKVATFCRGEQALVPLKD